MTPPRAKCEPWRPVRLGVQLRRLAVGARCSRALVLLLVAAGAPPPTVKVVPLDPTALFKGDGGAIKFDPTCRDYTLETVQSNAACAARVATAEAAPSLAIASRTVTTLPSRRTDAVRLLERSAVATDSPAVHYLLGAMLGTGEKFQPDYAKAVRHLTIAADRGNPAAADLLASLLVDGKGAARDVPRAVRYFSMAAANGWPSAAVSLGKLYLAGKFVPRDEARGMAWLDGAAAVNVTGASQLAALARIQTKIANFQLIPSADPAKVKAVRYGTFDNPDIPPNFGFDPAFQAVHDAPYEDAATLARLEREAAKLPTPYLYELARRLAARDAPRSLTTYLVARTRMAYDAARCADPASLESLRAWDVLILPELRFLFVDGLPSPEIVNRALAEEAKLAADTQPWWVCRSGMAAVDAAMSGKVGALRLKPEKEWPALRKLAEARLAELARRPS